MSCGAIARSRRARLRANGLPDRAREHATERRRGNHERAGWALLEQVAQSCADDGAEPYGRQPFRHPAEWTSGTPVILGERPEALRTGCQNIILASVRKREARRYACFIAPKTAMWLSTTRVRSASSGSSVHTPRCDVPPSTMPSLRAIMWMPRLAPGTGGTPPLV